MQASFYYFMLKDSDVKYRKGAFVLTLLLFVFIAVKEQAAFDTSSKLQVKSLISDYDKYEIELKSNLGIEAVSVSGEDVFNGICIACHNFETKIVGPPYKETLVKYEGKRDELIEFIQEDAEALGCLDEILGLKNILTDKTSAHRQLEVYNKSLKGGADHDQGLRDVVDWLIEETVRNI